MHSGTNRKPISVILLTTFFLTLTIATLDGNAGGKEKVKEEIKTLQKERLEEAIKLQKILQQRMLQMNVDLKPIFDVTLLVTKAKLDFCETKQERIKILEEAIKSMEQLDKIVQQKMKVGTSIQSLVDGPTIRIHLLEMRIALLKEKLAN